VIPTTEIEEDKRTKLLRLKLDPMMNESSKEKLLPKRLQPITVTPDPKRTFARRETVDPSVRESRSDIEEPNDKNPCKLIADESLENDRTLKLDPR
jgi:hypothetical protein